jgi:hypothetical protein
MDSESSMTLHVEKHFQTDTSSIITDENLTKNNKDQESNNNTKYLKSQCENSLDSQILQRKLTQSLLYKLHKGF